MASGSIAGAGHPTSERGGGEPKRMPLLVGRSYTAQQLLARDLPELNWVVPGLIAEGLIIVAGRPKLGKSWLVLQLCIKVSTGGQMLGPYHVEAGEALYIALEDSERRLQNRLKKLGISKGNAHHRGAIIVAFWPICQ